MSFPCPHSLHLYSLDPLIIPNQGRRECWWQSCHQLRDKRRQFISQSQGTHPIESYSPICGKMIHPIPHMTILRKVKENQDGIENSGVIEQLKLNGGFQWYRSLERTQSKLNKSVTFYLPFKKRMPVFLKIVLHPENSKLIIFNFKMAAAADQELDCRHI